MTPKTLERILILRTIMRWCPPRDRRGLRAVEIADRAGAERETHPLLEGVPAVSERAAVQMLSAMAAAGLVHGSCDKDLRLMFWSVTDAGRELAASIGMGRR